MARPIKIAKLVKGKLIDAFENFVDTFNWVSNFVYYLKFDDWFKLDETVCNRPVLRFLGEADDASLSIDSNPDDYGNSSKKFKVYGFDGASEGTSPVKSGGVIVWQDLSGGGGGGGSANIRIVGTDNTSAIVGNPAATNYKTLTFSSAEDSNVIVSVAGTDGNVTVTVGVHYK